MRCTLQTFCFIVALFFSLSLNFSHRHRRTPEDTVSPVLPSDSGDVPVVLLPDRVHRHWPGSGEGKNRNREEKKAFQ